MEHQKVAEVVHMVRRHNLIRMVLLHNLAVGILGERKHYWKMHKYLTWAEGLAAHRCCMDLSALVQYLLLLLLQRVDRYDQLEPDLKFWPLLLVAGRISLSVPLSLKQV